MTVNYAIEYDLYSHTDCITIDLPSQIDLLQIKSEAILTYLLLPLNPICLRTTCTNRPARSLQQTFCIGLRAHPASSETAWGVGSQEVENQRQDGFWVAPPSCKLQFPDHIHTLVSIFLDYILYDQIRIALPRDTINKHLDRFFQSRKPSKVLEKDALQRRLSCPDSLVCQAEKMYAIVDHCIFDIL